MLHVWRMRWWRVRTRIHITLPWVAGKWRRCFRTNVHLIHARHYAEKPELGHSQMAYETMAGFYNDNVRGGFMTAEQAQRIYLGF